MRALLLRGGGANAVHAVRERVAYNGGTALTCCTRLWYANIAVRLRRTALLRMQVSFVPCSESAERVHQAAGRRMAISDGKGAGDGMGGGGAEHSINGASLSERVARRASAAASCVAGINVAGVATSLNLRASFACIISIRIVTFAVRASARHPP